MDTPALANDKYRATLRTTFIDGVDTTLAVTAIPPNRPTIVVVGWNTAYETKFKITGVSGTNSSNYALTGLTKISGFSGNLPENLAVNCLNTEDFFNQYGTMIADIRSDVDDALATFPSSGVVGLTETQTLTNKRVTKRVQSITSSATPTPNADSDDMVKITALAAAAELKNPSGTPTEGQVLIVRIKDNGTARALTYDTQYRAGTDVPLPSTTILSKTLYLLFIYNSTDTKWDLVDVVENI